MHTRVVMGIDPGLQHCGWGVISLCGNHTSFQACGRITSEAGQDLADRLLFIFEALKVVLTAHKPDEVAVEQTFVSRDAVASLKLGHARAMALIAPRICGLPVFEYAPNKVKKSVVGVGHADKIQVQHMIRLLLPGAEFRSPDEADALAIALCHAHHQPQGRNPLAQGEVL